MGNKQDFVIKDGVLKKHTGFGRDVTIPEGVTKVSDGAFQYCASLTSVTIPESVTKIGKDTFLDSFPALIAPHIPVSDFDTSDKPKACAGFAKACLDGREIDEEIKAGYLKYIKGQRKRLFPAAIQHEDLLQLMLAEKMLVRKDIDLLLERPQPTANTPHDLKPSAQLDTTL